MGHEPTTATPPAQTDFIAALTATQAVVQAFAQQQTQAEQALANMQQQLSQLQAQHQDLVTQLSKQPQDTPRPTAAGGNGQELAEF